MTITSRTWPNTRLRSQPSESHPENLRPFTLFYGLLRPFTPKSFTTVNAATLNAVMTRQGKVARLPAALRSQVNQFMHDGTPCRKIIAWLADQGHSGFNHANLSRWKQGGFLDWLKAEERLDQRDFKHELARQQAKTNDPTFHDAAVYIAQLQFYEALNRLDGAELANLVKENRKEFIQLLKTFTHFNRYCLQREKFRSELQHKNNSERARNRTPKKAITDPTLEKICDQLNLK
jgi:hypothetical protein